jgi:hypothetical protein
MFYRRKLVLAVLEQNGNSLGEDGIHSLLLQISAQQKTASYDFIPVRGKCFSFQLQHDLELMCREGLLAVNEGVYSKRTSQHYFQELKKAEQSILRSSESLFDTECAVHHVNDTAPAMFTIGYEGLSLEKYLRKLLEQNVTVLCDVRKNAFSMKFGFSKHQLKPACEAVGMRYEHIPALGIESELRKGIKPVDKGELFRDYAERTLPENIDAVNALLRMLRSGERIALTCFEADRCDCHRGPLADLIEKLGKNEMQATHL